MEVSAALTSSGINEIGVGLQVRLVHAVAVIVHANWEIANQSLPQTTSVTMHAKVLRDHLFTFQHVVAHLM